MFCLIELFPCLQQFLYKIITFNIKHFTKYYKLNLIYIFQNDTHQIVQQLTMVVVVVGRALIIQELV